MLLGAWVFFYPVNEYSILLQQKPPTELLNCYFTFFKQK